jgi:hypothetical protein
VALSLKPRKRRKSRRAKRGFHNSIKCLTLMNYRSSWELKYALHLDSNEDVLSYKYEPYAISYISNIRTKRLRKYYPDFEVTKKDGTKFLVEVKPKNKVANIKNVKKANAAKEYALLNNMTYLLITEDDLKRLELL